MSASSSAAASTTHTLNVYFCAWMVAGVRTQYENVRSVASAADGLTFHSVEINPWKPGGLIERTPLLGTRTKGSLRSFACTLPLFRDQGIDAIWTQVDTALFPFLATRARFSRIPYVLSTDATTAQVESFDDYKGHPTTPSFKHRVRDRISGYCYRNAALVLPWSHWAAEAIMKQFGVPEGRIRVVPPGVNLAEWTPQAAAGGKHADGPARLLFVGGDFARKGGPLLLDVFRARLRGRCELHLVTREPIEPEPGVFVYRDLGPNDPRLHRLYETSEALVLPTRADCFSLASIEAMASGLPVITCPVGGIPEIVRDGESGWLVPAGNGGALLAAIEALLADPARARTMGQSGRAIVEERFDAAKNARCVFSLLRQLHDERNRPHRTA
jgi:glycosyltransferase involved in cell wall biosynthesis